MLLEAHRFGVAQQPTGKQEQPLALTPATGNGHPQLAEHEPELR
jgi:hypothetical protein